MKTETPTVPDFVQPYLDQIVAEDRRMNFPCTPEVQATLAWGRWAGTLTNRELAETVMYVRSHCVQSHDNILSARLEEVWRRLHKSKRTRLKPLPVTA